MESLVKYLLVLFLTFAVGNCRVSDTQHDYRSDYAWNEDAEGWMKYHEVPSTWDEARLRCHAEGAVLASPLTLQLKKAVVTFVNKQIDTEDKQQHAIFSGVHCTFSKGDYTSIEGVPLRQLAVTWAPGEPDNFENSESCLAMMITGYNGTMADVRCGTVLPYVCYKKYTSPLTVTACGTIDTEYVFSSVTGSCYKYHGNRLVWSEAYMTCIAEGGHLAIINDENEAKVVQEILAKHPPKNTSVLTKNVNVISVGFHDWGQIS